MVVDVENIPDDQLAGTTIEEATLEETFREDMYKVSVQMITDAAVVPSESIFALVATPIREEARSQDT